MSSRKRTTMEFFIKQHEGGELKQLKHVVEYEWQSPEDPFELPEDVHCHECGAAERSGGGEWVIINSKTYL